MFKNPWDAEKRSFMLVSPAPVAYRFLAIGHLHRVSRQSDDKGDNELKLGAVLRSPGVYLIAEKTPKNLSLESN